MEANHHPHHHSFIVRAFSAFIEWGNRWLILSHWLFRGNEYMFKRIEALMLFMTALCLVLLLTVRWIPSVFSPLIVVFLVQRVLEFLIVYSRNFILKRGRVFTQFKNDQDRGAWLILMFSLSVIQVILVFAIAFNMLSLADPGAFNKMMGPLDSFYFSMITFLTVGYGDIKPVAALAKLLIIAHGFLTYFVLVVVINGLISNHFGGHGHSNSGPDPKDCD